MSNLGDNFTLEGKRIAIVDDVPENLKLLKSLLEKKQAQVFLFPSGEMALRAFTKNIPDLILLDINMPGLNGYEVCQRLKSVGGILADVPVIFVSAQDDIEAKTTAFIKGGADYICKPFKAEEVEARVATHLELAQKRKQMRMLLDATLTGAVKALFEMMSVSHPEMCQNNLKVSQLVTSMAQELNLSGVWRYQMAALLNNVGKMAQGSVNAEGELKGTTDSEFVNGLLSQIPGLDSVAQIIALPEPKLAPGLMWREGSYQEIGRHLIKVAKAYENLIISKKHSPAEALRVLRSSSRDYISDMVQALEKVVEIELSSQREGLRVSQLAPGMVLAEDVVTASGAIIMVRGIELSFMSCRILNNRAQKEAEDPIVQPIWVIRVVRLRAASAAS